MKCGILMKTGKKPHTWVFCNLSSNGKLGTQRDANGAAQENSIVEINSYRICLFVDLEGEKKDSKVFPV